jgi:reverse gyrase
MKSLVINPKNDDEFKFLSGLLKKLGVGTSTISREDLEDMGMSKLMRDVDRSKKVSRSQILKKLST